MNTRALIQALVFLQTRSLANALQKRLRRLKQPKYLIGAVVGLGYLYLWIGHSVLRGWAAPHGSTQVPETAAVTLQGIAAFVLLIVVAMLWIFTGSRAALQFTETELAFLLPAPLTRRMLVRYKMIRGQLGTLISALFITLFTGRFATDGRVLFHVAGWWIVLTLLNLHGIAASFTIQRLTERGLASWVRRLGALVVFGGILAAAVIWVRMLPQMPSAHLLRSPSDFSSGSEQLRAWADLALSTGPASWFLLPFRWTVQPWFATSALEFLKSLGPVVLLIGLHYWWVERLDVAFEEASIAQSQSVAERLAAMRARKLGEPVPRKAATIAPFDLASTGIPVVGLMWKNLIAFRASRRKLGILIGAVVVLGVGIRLPWVPEEAQIPVCAACAAMLAIVIALGGSFTSSALRRDLGILDVLKGYPLSGSQLVLGELLGPALMITVGQALLTLAVIVTLPTPSDSMDYSIGLAIAIAVAALVVVVPLNFVNALIPSAATLWFPAWAKPGKDIEQPGFEALGQRIVFAAAQILLMLVALLPAGLLAAGVFFLVNWVLGVIPALLAASFIASGLLALEAHFGIRLLGRLFDRYDASAEQ